MEPQVRYVTSADGTRIATWRLGKGAPLVHVTSIWAQPMEALWLIPTDWRHLERLAAKRMVVLYDNRGQGLSDRDVDDFSLEARVSDLAAVVESLRVPDVDLMASTNSGPVGITYAADNPEHVRHLILSSAAARGRDIRLDPKRHAIARLADVDWLLFNQVHALITHGFKEVAEKASEAMAGSMTPETFAAATRAAWQFDATESLSRVVCPTLVLHQWQRDVPIENAKQLAAAIPDARVVAYQQPYTTLFGSVETIENIEAFLDEEDATSVQASPAQAEPVDLPSGTAVILFADIVDSTALTERLGDTAFRTKARDLDAALRTTIREHSGTPIEGKLVGDGVLAVFTSARQAIEAALACAASGDDAGLPLHLGLHAGDVIREDNNVYGGAVNIASRISGLSAPGEVLVSDTVRSLARTSAGVSFDDRGEQSLKGVGEPVRMWAVREAE